MGEPLRVLILEDLPADAELAVRGLEAEGLVVTARRVETEADFVRELGEFRPDVVLADYKLPTFDGMSALRLARERAPWVPVIVVTGSLNEETAVECLKAGAADYVLKDHLGRLGSAVRSAVERRRAQESEARAIEALRVDEARLNALLDLSQRAEAFDEEEIVKLGLEEAVRLTGSRGGCLHYVSEDQDWIERSVWARTTPASEPGDQGRHSLRQAGPWADCVRTKTPVVHNAYVAAPGERGHVPSQAGIVRHLSVPILEDGKVRLVLGVGNKGADYDEADVRQVSLIADTVGRLVRRKRAEVQLRREKERLQAVIDNIPVMIVFFDEAARATLVNREFERVLGWTESEAREMDLAEACYPDAAVRERVRSLIARSDRVWREFPTRGKDGAFHDVRWANVRLADGTIIGFGEDIGERKAAEARLRQLSRAVEQSPVVVMITDTGGRIEYVNPRFTEITGYQGAEVLGLNPRILKSGETPPEAYRELWGQIMAGQAWEGEFHNRRKDGSLYWERDLITPIHDPEDRITHFVALKEDVTREKAQEEALRRTEAQFRQAQKMEAVGRLAGGVAHDFNNLLGVIGGYAEVLLRAATEEEQRKRLEEILRASERAAGLTRQLLAFSRQQVLEPKVVDLGALVAESEGMVRRLVGEDVELSVRRPSSLGRVMVDPNQMQQVLLNLVVNARDAMTKGGSLWIEVADAELDQAYSAVHEPLQPGRYVVLAVSDTGVGMDKETQARAFEPFYTTKEPGKGTGLGLSTVYGIVKQSGGFIWLYSEPGVGTAFKIYLPRVEDELTTEEARPRAPVRGGHETVLLVEDETALGTITTEMLEMSGFRVLSASSGFTALAMVRAGAAVDLLLTDMVMPGMSGRDLADHVRQLRPDLRVLFMSGYSDEVVGRHGALGPGEQLLQKPFNMSQLLASVRAALDKN
ncbi:MAG TPA: response regulator, partial [Vicinamibacteria bacterium]|nr:response regulator [Vicinamibacteria bacterium]